MPLPLLNSHAEHTSPEITAQIDVALREWRTRALDIVLVVVSLPAVISSVGNAIRTTPAEIDQNGSQ